MNARIGPRRFAWLGPEIPSISCTFVFREVLEVRALGAEVLTWSLHSVPADGLADDGAVFRSETPVLYRGAGPLLRGALRGFLRRPLRVLGGGLRMLGDAAFGRFARPAQRLKLPLQFLAAIDFAEQLRAAKVQHLHIHFAHAPATVGMYAAGLAGVPFSVTAHANDIYVEGSLLRQKARRALAFVTISAVNVRHLAAVTGLSESRFDIVRCGVDLARFALRSPERAQRAAAERRVFAVGRMVPKKGFDLLLEASAPLLKDGGMSRLVLAGGGPQLEELQQRAVELGIQERVEFAGVVDRERIRVELERAALFALPCRLAQDGDRDGIPVVLMEAMAAGVPVVSTPLSGIPELIEDDESGRLVDPDPAALREALRELLDDPGYAARLAAAGHSRVADEFDATGNAGRLLRRLQVG